MRWSSIGGDELTDYYVNNATGDNGNDGSASYPWETIAYSVTQLSAGDRLRIQGGANPGSRQDYNETVVITSGAGCSAGSSGNEITVMNEPGEYIRLYSASTTRLLDIRLAYWIIQGGAFDLESGDPEFELDRQDVTSSGYAVDIYETSHVTLSYLHIHNALYETIVRIRGSSDCRIEYCRIHDNAATPGADHHGLLVYSDDSGYPCDDDVVSGCRIYDCAGDCIQLQTQLTGAISGFIVEDTYMYTTLGAASEQGFDDKDGIDSIVRRCTFYGFRECDGSVGGTGADGQAIIIQGDTSGAQIYENEIYDISGAAVRIDADNVVFRNNVIHSLVYEADIDFRHTLFITATASAVDIFNNVIGGDYGGYGNSFKTVTGSSCELRNNVFYDCNTVDDDGTTTASNNCWYSCVGSVSGSGDITSDPLFVNRAGHDYRLQSSSPCIDAGTDVGLPYQNTAPDMGAFESPVFVSGIASLEGFGTAVVSVASALSILPGGIASLEGFGTPLVAGEVAVYVSGAHMVVSGAHVVMGG